MRQASWAGVQSLAALAASAICVAILAWSLARLAWVVLAAPGHDVRIAGPIAARADVAPEADYTILQRITPFRAPGESEDSPPDTALLDAPDTTLDLVLHGVLMRADTGGVAYISVGEARQKSYRVGDRLASAGNVQIVRILPNAVLLDRSGIQERLTRENAGEAAGEKGIVTLVDGQRPQAAPADKPAEETAAQAGVRAETVPAADATPDIRRAAASLSRAQFEELAESIRFEDRTGAVEKGFSVFPTRRAELFAKAGLRPGDVIQAVGGIELAEVSDIERVFADIESETELDVRLVRAGEPRLLTLRLAGER